MSKQAMRKTTIAPALACDCCCRPIHFGEEFAKAEREHNFGSLPWVFCRECNQAAREADEVKRARMIHSAILIHAGRFGRAWRDAVVKRLHGNAFPTIDLLPDCVAIDRKETKRLAAAHV